MPLAGRAVLSAPFRRVSFSIVQAVPQGHASAADTARNDRIGAESRHTCRPARHPVSGVRGHAASAPAVQVRGAVHPTTAPGTGSTVNSIRNIFGTAIAVMA
ncbi:MAG: hypothetical protein ACK5V2_08245, partial [Pseudomonadota bacterium]